jgi:preprotein translocase SecE subunit
LYKPGQGYWVRVLTACFLSLLTVSGIAWGWANAGLFTPSTPTWSVAVSEPVGTPAAGQVVTLKQSPRTGETEATVVGSAKIESVGQGATGKYTLVIGSITLSEKRSVKDASTLESVGTPPAFSGKVSGSIGIPSFDRKWLQGGAAIAILILGCVFTYWIVGVRHRSVDFLVSTDGEMKKVNWSTRRAIIDSTQVVVAACFLIAALLYFSDFLFQTFFTLLGVLERK